MLIIVKLQTNHSAYWGNAVSVQRRVYEGFMKTTFRLLIATICVAALSGCGQTLYPRLSNLTGIGQGALSPEQQQQAINDLSNEQKNHGAEAVEEIEQR